MFLPQLLPDAMQYSKDHRASREPSHPSHSNKQPAQNRHEEFCNETLEKHFGKKYTEYILSPKPTLAINDFIDKTQKYVQSNVGSWTASQLRNIFVRVKQAQKEEDLYRLRPQLAYISGRALSSDNKNKQQFRILLFLLDTLIKNITTKEQLEEFKLFFESIIAYHKYYGGKD